MSFDTYGNLQSEIISKLNRSDADAIARCPGWITLAEDEMRMSLTRLMVRQGEITDPNYQITDEYNDLPTGFFRARNITIRSSNPYCTLDYVSPNIADAWDPYASASLPRLWTIQNNQLRVFPPPDATYTATFTYFSLPSLSVSAPTNWLLAAHPKLYFKAALAEAYDYYDDGAARDAAQSERDRMLSSIYTSDGSDQHGTSMRMRINGAVC